MEDMLEKAKSEIGFMEDMLEDDYMVLLDIATNLQIVVHDLARHLLVPLYISSEKFKEKINDETSSHVLDNVEILLKKYRPDLDYFLEILKDIRNYHLELLDFKTHAKYESVKESLEKLRNLVDNIEKEGDIN